MNETTRHIQLEAVHNFRDIGGYRARDGTFVKHSLVYRADGLYRLSKTDIDVMRRLDIKTVIDLRTENELKDSGTFPRDDHPVDFHNIPLMDVVWEKSEIPHFDDVADFLVWGYRDIMQDAQDRFARAFDLVARQEAPPVVYHCAAGKDRTGLLTMMLLGALGVSRDDIVNDYALSSDAMKRLQEWAFRTYPERSHALKDAPAFFLAAEPRAMHAIIDDFTAGHDDFADAVIAYGINEESVERLHSFMLT
jgi:protein-tyrosine phosphatase